MTNFASRADLEQQLGKIRALDPGCRLVAFGDLGSHLVLAASHDHPWPQERLDDLCLQAAEGFAMLDQLDDANDFFVTLTSGSARLFLRASGGEQDALLIEGAQLSSVEPMVPQARLFLAAATEDA